MTASGSSRQQLDGWAEHVAAVRSGDLQVSRQLSGLKAFSWSELSPRLDYLAVVKSVGRFVTLVPVPAAGAQVDLQHLVEAEGQDLVVPSTRPGWAQVTDLRCAHLQQRHRCMVQAGSHAARTPLQRQGSMALCDEQWAQHMLGRRWCPAGTHLVIGTRNPKDAGRLLHVSTFQGTQLLGSFMQGEGCNIREISAGASSIFFELLHRGPSLSLCKTSVLAATLDGTVTARHDTVPCIRWQLNRDDSSLLGVSCTGRALFVCPAAAGMQTIDLGRPASEGPSKASGVSSRDGLAIVTCPNKPHPELLFVDLAGLRVVHRQALPPLCQHIAQSSRFAALWWPHSNGQTTVVATGMGAEAGRQLFMVPGGDIECVAWDALGRHLAVISADRVVTVYDGLSGIALACWSSSPTVEARLPLISVRWLPDSAGLVCGVLSHPQAVWYCEKVSGVRLLRFAGSAQLSPAQLGPAQLGLWRWCEQMWCSFWQLLR